MYIDATLKFNSAQAVTATAASTDYADLQAVRDIGTGENLYLVTVCNVAMTDAGSDSTLIVSLEGDSTTTFTPDGSDTLYTFSAVSAAGTTKIARLDPAMASLQFRYIQVKYTPGSGGNLSTGSFTSFITHNIDKYTSYADAITIS